MSDKAIVAIISTADRAEGVRRSIELLQMKDAAKGKSVLIKPNFNTADTYPGSTHNDTLEALLSSISAMSPASLSVGDRSGPTSTRKTLELKKVKPLCQKYDAELINFEEMPEARWEHFQPEGSHWRKGFFFAKPVLESDFVVSTCCLKAHGFGGGFTISLKNTIGMVHQKNMAELHTSFLSMKKMIAETNVPYRPALIVVDAIEAMVDKGPMVGPTKRADLFIAGTDRVAVDAVGVAVLKMLGSNDFIMGKPVFAHDQIIRAGELGLGVKGAGEIELLGDDEKSRSEASKLTEILL